MSASHPSSCLILSKSNTGCFVVVVFFFVFFFSSEYFGLYRVIKFESVFQPFEVWVGWDRALL